MVKRSGRTRFQDLVHVVELFNATLNKSFVEYEIIDDPYFINFDYIPVQDNLCSLNLTIDKFYPYLLTVHIGKKILYEEYEGANLPDANYLKALIESVTKGCVVETEFVFMHRVISYSGLVEINDYENIIVGNASLFSFLRSLSKEKKHTYKSWP